MRRNKINYDARLRKATENNRKRRSYLERETRIQSGTHKRILFKLCQMHIALRKDKNKCNDEGFIYNPQELSIALGVTESYLKEVITILDMSYYLNHNLGNRIQLDLSNACKEIEG